MRTRSLTLPLLSFLVLSMVFLAACGTLEISIETKGLSGEAEPPTFTAPAPAEGESLSPAPVTPTPTPWDYTPPTPEAASTPVPVEVYAAPGGLCIALVRDGDVWLWTAEEREFVPLTNIGDVGSDLRISDDGQLVTYRRGEELWLVSTDGTGERPLVTSVDFGELGPDGAGAMLSRFEWVPGTHVLAFNTRLPTAVGRVLNNDLQLVNADTLMRTTLLPPGEGGEFYYSPDGSQIALVTPNEISLIDADGGNRRDRILTHTPVATHSEYEYYARPVWAEDGSALRVVIPPPAPLLESVQLMTIWHLPTDGSPAWLVRSIVAAPSLDPNVLSFSSDLGYAAYVQLRGPENAVPEQMHGSLEVRLLEGDDVFAYPDAGVVFGWAPGSRRFAFLSARQVPQLQIGQWSGPNLPVSVDAGTPIVKFDWLDAEHYLLTSGQIQARGVGGGSYDLVLADISGSSTRLITGADVLYYDSVLVDKATQE